MFNKFLLGSISFFLILVLVNSQEISCETKNSEPGTCKRLEECPKVLEMLRLRKKDYKICSQDPLIFCCPLLNVVIQPLNLPVSDVEFDENTQTKKRLHEIKCTKYAEAVYVNERSKSLARNNNPKTIDKCGNRNIPLIVGGQIAGSREFPHMALVGYQYQGKIVWRCGGSLISEQYVLTAGHCLVTSLYGDALYIRLGELDLTRTNEDADPEDFQIIEKIPHPFYNASFKYHDIALLKLNQTVNIDPYKRPACLPTEFEGPEKNVIVTGWGRTRWSGEHSDELQKVVLHKFNRSDCNFIYTQAVDERLKIGIDEKTQLCAGSFDEKKDACQGDSGGPMQVFHQNEYCMYTIIGVTSFGILCGNPGVPGVYTRVYPYVDWIENIVWK